MARTEIYLMHKLNEDGDVDWEDFPELKYEYDYLIPITGNMQFTLGGDVYSIFIMEWELEDECLSLFLLRSDEIAFVSQPLNYGAHDLLINKYKT